MRRLALITSVVVHPLLMPLLATFIAFKFDWYLDGRISGDQENVIYLIIALSTIAFPGINILLLRWYGVVTSLSLPVREERFVPFISTLFFFGLGYYLLRKGNLPETVYSIYLGCTLTAMLIVLITTRWKISVHSAAIAGVLGITLALFRVHEFSNVILVAALVILAGLTLSSRLVLNAHTPAQVYVGALVGASVSYFSVVFGLVI